MTEKQKKRKFNLEQQKELIKHKIEKLELQLKLIEIDLSSIDSKELE
jgi:hypothetical protein